MLSCHGSGLCWYAARLSGEHHESKSTKQGLDLLFGVTVVGTAIALSINNKTSSAESGQLDLDPNSEVGRENTGLLVVALWFSLLTIHQRFQPAWFSLMICLVATSLCLATAVVPMLLVNKAELVEHCTGMGPWQ